MSTVSPAVVPPPVTATIAGMNRLTVVEYELLAERGFFEDGNRYELIDGYVVRKMPGNPPHDNTIRRLLRLLRAAIPPGWMVDSQLSLRLSNSVPLPDAAVVRGDETTYAAAHPTSADVAVVIEVADTSLAGDRGDKRAMYAAAGIAAYWIVNINDRQVEVYTQPAAGRYGSRADYRPGDAVPVAVAGVAVGRLAVSDLLP